MKYCNQCGHPIDGGKFCNQCGTHVMPEAQTGYVEAATAVNSQGGVEANASRPALAEVKPIKLDIRWKIVGPVLGILAAIGVFYWAGSMYSDPERVVEKFEKAVEAEDVDQFLSMVVLPEEIEDAYDLREEDAKKVIESIREQDELDAYIAELKEEAELYRENPDYKHVKSHLESAPLVLLQDGKRWFLFRNYKIRLLPTYAYAAVPSNVTLSSSEEGVKVEKADEQSDEESVTYKIGPLFPGDHKIKATLASAFGEVSNETFFDVEFGETSVSVEAHLDTRQVELSAEYLPTNDLSSVKVYYKDQPLDVSFEESWGSYEATIDDVPTVEVPVTVKVATPFGEIQKEIVIPEDDDGVYFEISMADAPEAKTVVGNLIKAYYKANEAYGKNQQNKDQVKAHLTVDSPLAQALDSGDNWTFAGTYTALAADYSSMRVEGADTAFVKVRVTYTDQWKTESGEIVGSGSEHQQDVQFELRFVDGVWKIHNLSDTYSWNDDSYEDIPLP